MHAVSHAHSIFPQGQLVLTGGVFSSFSLKRALGWFVVSAVQPRIFLNLLKYCAQISILGGPSRVMATVSALVQLFSLWKYKVATKWDICHLKCLLFCVQMLASLVSSSRGRFGLCLSTLYVLLFQMTAAEVKVGKRWKRNISFDFILSPTVLGFRPIAIFLSLFLSLSLFLCSSHCVFKVKAAPSLIICVCLCVHARDRRSNGSDCIVIYFACFKSAQSSHCDIHIQRLGNEPLWIDMVKPNTGLRKEWYLLSFHNLLNH